MSWSSEDAAMSAADRFRTYRRTGDRVLRDELVEENLGLAEALARRYDGRGVPFDDLAQVATIGLLKAVMRFDPDLGTAFSSFAVPTILGELRHHFRDHGWTVSVPRRLQELRHRADRAVADLRQVLGREPSVDEVASHVREDRDTVLLALDGLRTAYTPGTLDTGAGDRIPSPTRAHEHVEDRIVVQELLDTLPARQRQIVTLRFWDELSQQQIAERIGCSQMHVSRLLRRSLSTLQEAAGASPG